MTRDGGASEHGVDARRTAIDALVRIEQGAAYANLLLPRVLDRSPLSDRDRRFVTELVYGTTRYRRAADWFIDRFTHREVDPPTRAALRMGTYQLRVLGTPAHAAVSSTVGAVPRRARGFVNAVLRKIVDAEDAWPSDAVRLSYPDWLVEHLVADLGVDDALGALTSMNEPASVTERADGYVQDRASQLVVEAVGAGSGETVLDLCAAPGGKATALVATGARVVAADLRHRRTRLIAQNRTRLGIAAERLAITTADGTRPPFGAESFDRVLVDAPCSGLGSLRRRPDARWRIDPGAPERLAALQGDLLESAATLVRPGGLLVYAVCTLTRAETLDVVDRFRTARPDWDMDDPPASPWRPWGRGGILLPQDQGSDGMAIALLRAPEVLK